MINRNQRIILYIFIALFLGISWIGIYKEVGNEMQNSYAFYTMIVPCFSILIGLFTLLIGRRINYSVSISWVAMTLANIFLIFIGMINYKSDLSYDTFFLFWILGSWVLLTLIGIVCVLGENKENLMRNIYITTSIGFISFYSLSYLNERLTSLSYIHFLENISGVTMFIFISYAKVVFFALLIIIVLFDVYKDDLLKVD
ncbi:hypothetical protein DFO70_13012 [Cytobacillus firmus]|uniref:Uncharacterized protein n=2 Tax=Cytobacillus TaxID=2675230 RepID=A0A366JGW5_CYTFI|nr:MULTISPECIES: hypothetical protein [Cytobacillus]RBP86206.1 hypothetical protein DFO70_13012 [Cytobacillus firmus]TDX45533.1 hypothetical protein DFO72_1021 [Cytobacillus oceanisediminis]